MIFRVENTLQKFVKMMLYGKMKWKQSWIETNITKMEKVKSVKNDNMATGL